MMNEYSPSYGLSIGIDGLFKTPGKSASFYGGLISLNPPGHFYTKDGPDDQAQLVTKIDFSSQSRSPEFIDGMFQF